MMKPIGLAWVITLPAAAFLSVVNFLILRAVFLSIAADKKAACTRIFGGAGCFFYVGNGAF